MMDLCPAQIWHGSVQLTPRMNGPNDGPIKTGRGAKRN